MGNLKSSSGFTRLEAALAGLLSLSIVLTAITLIPHSGTEEEQPAPVTPAVEDVGAGDDAVLLEMVRESVGPAKDKQDDVPSLKGRTNKPAPSKAVAGPVKQPAQPLVKKPPHKVAPPAGAKPPPPPQKKNAPVKNAVKTTANPKQQPKKIPGVKSELIDAPPAVMEILVELEGQDWSREVEVKLLAAVRRWARDDLAAASEFSLGIERRGTRNAALSSVLNTWVVTEPAQAQAWFNAAAEKGTFLVEDLTRQFYSKLAVKAPVAAMDGLWDLPTDAMKKAALQSVSQRLIYLGREQDVLDMYGVVEAQQDRQIVIDVIMQSMARYQPRELGEWVFTLPDEQQRRRALNGLVGSWSRDYPSEAADWVAAEVPDDEGRAQQMATVVGNWVMEDPVEAAEWLLGQFPESRQTDPSVLRFARAVLPQDPAYAAAWSFSVVDNGERWKLMEQIAASWKRQSQVEASEYINRTDLPDHVKKRLLK